MILTSKNYLVNCQKIKKKNSPFSNFKKKGNLCMARLCGKHLPSKPGDYFMLGAGRWVRSALEKKKFKKINSRGKAALRKKKKKKSKENQTCVSCTGIGTNEKSVTIQPHTSIQLVKSKGLIHSQISSECKGQKLWTRDGMNGMNGTNEYCMK
jgi:hypothetical protein